MITRRSTTWVHFLLRAAALPAAFSLLAGLTPSEAAPRSTDHPYEYADTRDLVTLVNDAADLVATKGAKAFTDFRVDGSRWRADDTYVFVLDPDGNMLVHPDPALEGRNEIELKDVGGKPIIRGLIAAVTIDPDKPEGWYHYQWPVPRGLLPRWKSTFVRLVTGPSGKRYIVGSGVYNDRMERAFVIDMVNNAAAELAKDGAGALRLFHDPTAPYLAKDAYVFVYDMNGASLAIPPFPNLEKRELIDMKDAQGKPIIREMLRVVRDKGSGWVDYMWPKPGESVPTRKSAYVRMANFGDQWVLVGCGVYLADAPKAKTTTKKMKAAELKALVREAAAMLQQRGEQAFPELRTKGSRWLSDDTYFFVWKLDGTRVFHAIDPSLEGLDGSSVEDVLGRRYGQMFLDAAASPSGEGWVHYMYPEPGGLFPVWKSVFVKRVTFPSGTPHLIGAGIYNMQMDRAFVEDLVDRASVRVAEHGPRAFAELRDKTGPFVFMDTYVFVDTLDGTELVNAAQPSLEGKNLIDVKDSRGTPLVKDYIAAAMKDGNAWVDYYWYKPGQNVTMRKHTYVRKVQAGDATYVVGSGVYLPE
jgi:signal transduction histidine kinase